MNKLTELFEHLDGAVAEEEKMVTIMDSLPPDGVRPTDAMKAAAPAAWEYDVESRSLLISDIAAGLYGFAHGSFLKLAQLRDATFRFEQQWMEGLEEGSARFEQDHIEYRIRRVDTGEVRWLKAQIETHYRPGLQRAQSYTVKLEDITEQRRATYALMESETRLRLAIEAGKMAVWEVDLEAGTVTNSLELNLLFGLPPDAKPTLQDLRALYAPGEIERLAKEGATFEVVRTRYATGQLRPKHGALAAEGEDRTQVQADLTIITPAGTKKRLLYRAQYTFSLEGRPQITGLLIDITDSKLAEERLGLLASELQHRVKNSLSIVQALAVQTLRTSSNREESLENFLGRLKALATATDIVLASGSGWADMGEIAAGITQPYRSATADPFLISGQQVKLGGKAATALSMILHELCTNAVKYGALSVPQGRVRLSWEALENGKLVIEWVEENGPPTQAPLTIGFGARLLNTIVPADLAGSLELIFEPDGVICRIKTGQNIVL